MSMTLNLEISEGITLEEVERALALSVQVALVRRDSFWEAYFPSSNVSVSLKTNLSDSSVLTEDLGEVGWKVGMRIYFDIDPALPNALEDIKRFVLSLAQVTRAPFALSFEYETLYAQRGEGEVIFSDDMR